jgi:hypothetical protein
LYFDQLFLIDVFGVILEDVEEALFILLLDGFEHLFALGVEILADIELFLLVVLIVLLVVCLLDFAHFLGFVVVEAEDVVEVALIDVHVLIFFIELEVFQQFDVDLHALLDAVVGDGPAGDHAVAHLPLLDPDDEVLGTLPHPLLQVLQDLRGVLAEVDIDSLGLRLQDAVFVH